VGKTHLAIALGVAAVEKGYEVCFRSIYGFLDEMAIARATNNRGAFMKKMVGAPLFILDEFGIKNIPPAFSEDLIEIFHRRYGVGSTVICTNRPIQDWGEILGDVPASTSILDRFLEGIKLFKITGNSYRLQGDKTVKDQKEVVA
jgi:DNA replication protein DnaC